VPAGRIGDQQPVDHELLVAQLRFVGHRVRVTAGQQVLDGPIGDRDAPVVLVLDATGGGQVDEVEGGQHHDDGDQQGEAGRPGPHRRPPGQQQPVQHQQRWEQRYDQRCAAHRDGEDAGDSTERRDLEPARVPGGGRGVRH
jgi:hypothetical protein